jgi:hypothetical protein
VLRSRARDADSSQLLPCRRRKQVGPPFMITNKVVRGGGPTCFFDLSIRLDERPAKVLQLREIRGSNKVADNGRDTVTDCLNHETDVETE